MIKDFWNNQSEVNKAIIYLLILILIVVVSLISVSAITFPFNKAQTCGAFNVTGEICETFWCNEVQEGNYSTSKEICIFEIFIGNSTNQTSLNNGSFYTKKEVGLLINETINQTLEEVQTNYRNFFGIEDDNFDNSSFYNRTKIDNLFSILRINFTQGFAKQDDIDNLRRDGSTSSSGGLIGGFTGGELIFGFLVLVGIVLAFIVNAKFKATQTPSQQGQAPVSFSKIQTPKEREKDEEIVELKESQKKQEEIEKLKKDLEDIATKDKDKKYGDTIEGLRKQIEDKEKKGTG